jgi:hypothetical protein
VKLYVTVVDVMLPVFRVLKKLNSGYVNCIKIMVGESVQHVGKAVTLPNLLNFLALLSKY